MQNDEQVQKSSRMQQFWKPILAGLAYGVFSGVVLGLFAVAAFATPVVALPIFIATLFLCAAVGALSGLIGGLFSLSDSAAVNSAAPTQGLSSTEKPSYDHNPLAGLGKSVEPVARNGSAPENFPEPFSTPANKTLPAEPGSTPSPKI